MPSLSINLLRNVSGVGAKTIGAFIEAGYRSLDDVKGVGKEALLAIPGVGEATADAILGFLANVDAAHDLVQAYRYDDKRTNIPPAGLAAQGKVADAPTTRYSYDPHLPPVLRFDDSGETDRLPELLQTARQRALSAEEARLLAEALRQHQPWLEWTGKREARWFEVDPVALHIHERVSAEAILKLARRQPLQRSLFADPEMEYHEAVKFYQHDMDWANRLILGDSLVVMNSLARREDLAGKVQMIYIDPPYGIKFASNFQPFVNNREVKDRDQDMTREPEQVKAYRDTWTLGVHSYLAYLQHRLIAAKDLLTDSGSVFVQIGDENVHRVRAVMDEVFGPEHCCGEIIFVKTSGLGSRLLADRVDVLLWYARDIEHVKYRQLFLPKGFEEGTASNYGWLQLPSGMRRGMTRREMAFPDRIQPGSKVYKADNITSQGNPVLPHEYDGKTYRQAWKTNPEGMTRLAMAERLHVARNSLQYVRYLHDFRVVPVTKLWSDTATGSFTDTKIYVVQTGTKTIERCILMTTDPGDLVLDPTCGSGTTAYVAEQWGRRWITIDTSRVALALARQRLLTATFDYYEKQHPAQPLHPERNTFRYETVPHITLKSIAQNQALDPIFARWEPVLAEKLAELNATLAQVTPETRTTLQRKLVQKERQKGKRAISDADRRRWLLPSPSEGEGQGGGGWQEWEVPFDADPDWPPALQAALTDYRSAWRAKMDEVNATVEASAPQETLVDRPEVVKGITRVSGPFTVEGVQPAEETLDMDSPIGGEPEDLDTFAGGDLAGEASNAEAYLDKMIRLLRTDGVRFPDNKVVKPARLEPLPNSLLHAEGEWVIGGEQHRLAVAFGPQYGPITARQVEQCLREAYRRGYDDLVFAGFTIDGAAQAAIQADANPEVRTHLAHIRPDVNMGDLLKDTPSSQLFTVFGLPRVILNRGDDGEFTVTMEGVDIYDPVANTIHATKADKVAAWFLDSGYDGRTFCISQAFFPDKSAWDKLKRALKTVVEPEKFAAFAGTTSLPFPAGEHNRIAVKVIDPRGNEVMRVLWLEGSRGYG